MKIYISPSSQEANKYATGQTEEAIMNLVADALCPELTRHGVEWQRNKKTGTYADHVAQSNAYGPDIHLAIHSNAMSGTAAGKARGCEVYVANPANKASIATQLAERLYLRISTLTPSADRGIKAGTMAEVKLTHAPAVLIELAFHDNPDDAAWIVSHIAEISKALLLSILNQFGILYIPFPTTACDTLQARGVVFDSKWWNVKAAQNKALGAVLSAIANNWTELDKVPYVGTLLQRVGDKLGN